jgi:hypothetical protein
MSSDALVVRLDQMLADLADAVARQQHDQRCGSG